MRTATDRKKQTYDKGRLAEALAVFWLTVKGYRILAQRFRTHRGEVDIVACRGRTVAAVEVKARATIRAALEAIGPRQRRRIERAAADFMATRMLSTDATADWTLRFDVLLISPWSLPRHIANAWQAETRQG